MAQTQIHGGTQIRAGTITNAGISASAAIALSKLAEAVIQADGGQAFTADQSLGGFKLTNVANGTAASDAVNFSQLQGVAQGLDYKESVRVATTAAATLSSDFENGDTIDGVALVTGNRVLIKNQATGSENGLYTVNASGAPTRATDADVSAEVTTGMTVWVEEGTANIGTRWTLNTTGTIVLGTTALTFVTTGGSESTVAGAGLTLTGSTVDVVAADSSLDVQANSVAVKRADASIEVDGANGIRVNPGVDGTVMITVDGVVTAVALSGDATVTEAGVVTLAASVVKDADCVTRETPTGAVDGVNDSYALANTPVAGSEEVFLDGLLQEPGGGNDYTISSGTITMEDPPLTGQRLRVSYRK